MKNTNFLSNLPNHTILVALVFCFVFGFFIGILVTSNFQQSKAEKSFKELLIENIGSSKENIKTFAKKGKDLIIQELEKDLNLVQEQKNEIMKVINTQRDAMITLKKDLREKLLQSKDSLLNILNTEQQQKLKNKIRWFKIE